MTLACAPTPETVALHDGTVLTIRPICACDAPRLQAFHARLSPESIYLRYFGLHPVLTRAEAERLTRIDYETRMALVATRGQGDDEAIVGVARYYTLEPLQAGEAEPAIVIEDAYQGHGLGTLLLERLTTYAQARGLGSFVFEVSSANERMLGLIHQIGLPTESESSGDSCVIRVRLQAAPELEVAA